MYCIDCRAKWKNKNIYFSLKYCTLPHELTIYHARQGHHDFQEPFSAKTIIKYILLTFFLYTISFLKQDILQIYLRIQRILQIQCGTSPRKCYFFFFFRSYTRKKNHHKTSFVAFFQHHRIFKVHSGPCGDILKIQYTVINYVNEYIVRLLAR